MIMESETNLIEENINKLKKLFPELVNEGKNGNEVNIHVLKILVGDKSVSEHEEKYGLSWYGKRRAQQLALTRSNGTLRPCIEESVNWNTTQNLIIEGDNLEVLKLLQKSYSGKVKLIYIDPPYNTGKDFVYPDNFQDSIRNYMELTDQIKATGQKVSSNTESSGRFHTDWLNMMYPRLKLSRNLLEPSGIILISIGDEEMHNLREICDEIFGIENFCGVFVWEKKKKPSFLDQNMGSVTDYVVAYARNRQLTSPFTAGTVEDGKKYPFNNAGNPLSVLRFPPYSVQFSCSDQLIKSQDMSEGNIKTELLDDVEIVDGVNANEFRLKGEWRYSQSKVDEFVSAKAEIVISKVPFRPNYVNRSSQTKKTSNLLSHRVNNVPTNEDATEEIRTLFGADVMNYPKPTGLIKYLISAVTKDSDIVLDFFAGSGTTGHATVAQNIEDGSSRRYILVQLPEPLIPQNKDHKTALDFLQKIKKPLNIAELTKERLRRVAKKSKENDSDYVGDLGFRIFKLDSTNIREWDSRPDDLENSIRASVDHIKPGRTEEDILYELLLMFGSDLCVSIEKRRIEGKDVCSIVGRGMMACLTDRITGAEAEKLALGIAEWHEELGMDRDTTCVFRDSAFADDTAKTNLSVILKQHGISDVRSL